MDSNHHVQIWSLGCYQLQQTRKCGRRPIRTATVAASTRCSTIGAIRPCAESVRISLTQAKPDHRLASGYDTALSTLRELREEKGGKELKE